MECLRDGKVAEFAPVLLKLAADPNRPKDLRVAALAAAVPQLKQLDPEPFQFLCACLAEDQPPLLRLAAADVLGRAPLNGAQLQSLAVRVGRTGPLEAGRLVAAFEQSGDAGAGKALVANLEHSPGLAGLSPGALRNAVRNYPAEVREAAEALCKKIDVGAEEQKKHLTELQTLLDGGDADNGRNIFFGNRTACSACHTVNGRGGRVGPELSKIGSIRRPPTCWSPSSTPAPPSSAATRPTSSRRGTAGRSRDCWPARRPTRFTSRRPSAPRSACRGRRSIRSRRGGSRSCRKVWRVK